jgi:hypothetical protein
MTCSTRLIMVTAILLLLPLLICSSRAQQHEPEIHGIFDGDSMYSVLPPGAITAIDDPGFLTGNSADKQMSPDEPVLGVVINGDARAYSLWQLDSHEIVNDVVGGIPITATW